jgi:hypothetical protein
VAAFEYPFWIALVITILPPVVLPSSCNFWWVVAKKKFICAASATIEFDILTPVETCEPQSIAHQ